MKNKQKLLFAMILAAFVVPVALLVINLVQKSPQNDLKDYLQRIARVQNAQIIEWEFKPFISPSRRTFYQPVERLTIGIVESTQLRKCDLLEMVYLHNDALGKVQDPFRNLDYQVNVLIGLERCIKGRDLTPELTNKLKNIVNEKWKQLPMHINNALFYSEAGHKQRYSEQWLSIDSTPANQFYRDLAKVLDELIIGYELKDLPLQFTVVAYQEQLEKNRHIGELLYSLHFTNQWLEQINQQLTQYDSNVLCSTGRQTEQITIMLNIFSELYVKRLQPYFSQLNQHYHSVVPLLEIYQHPILLIQGSEDLTEHYLRFKTNLQQHVEYWTQLRERCGVSMHQLMGRESE
ncbi:DUF3080 family protein [Vibrio ulleungensis]|uniref:DUF3080 family protein n=1 Tax=Vibrio ulleungensis TaxID=2807619 RepID=A0ABS2HE43_9VIBR|nr:DUF3080 family protein [Vibrio ulleungensis]MBM7035855.1 DUF3080 family protein [Vibrio ulleungensis]